MSKKTKNILTFTLRMITFLPTFIIFTRFFNASIAMALMIFEVTILIVEMILFFKKSKLINWVDMISTSILSIFFLVRMLIFNGTLHFNEKCIDFFMELTLLLVWYGGTALILYREEKRNDKEKK